MRPLSIHLLQELARLRRASLLAGSALAVLGLPDAGHAQFFKISAQGGNTFGHPAPPCTSVAYSVTQSLPLTDSSACSVAGHLWSSTTAADRGILYAESYVEYNVLNSLGTEFHTFGQFDQDVVISGPAGPVTLTLLLDVEYVESENAPFGFAGAEGWVFVGLAAPTQSFKMLSPTEQRLAVTRTVDANTPQKLNVEARADTSVGGAFAGNGQSAAAEITLRFPIGEPVFLLPPGYTADSPELGIVNNLWVGPELCGLPAQEYCTAGTSASGCTATLSSSGIPSVSSATGFTVVASNVEGTKDGLYFYGFNGAQVNSWGNGTSYQCVVPPVFRTPVLAGNGTAGLCDGSLGRDFNAFWAAAAPSKVPVPGQQVNVQLWYRDPASSSNQTTSLSDALQFIVCP